MRRTQWLRPILTTALSAAVVGTLTVLSACGSSGADAATSSTAHRTTTGRQTAPAARRTVTLPPVAARASYQLGGAFTPVAGVGIVTRDRTDSPARGQYSVCYVNGFQTQPEETAWWKKHHPSLLLRDSHGRIVMDTVWNEAILDISTKAKRTALLGIVGGWFDRCAAKGFRAVEADNLDTYTRSHHLLTAADAVAFEGLLAARAHSQGLALAQKNAGDLSRRLHAAHVDFAVAEECQVYSECGSYTSVYGRHVIEIEYTDQPLRFFTAACAARGSQVSVLLRDRDVAPRGSKGYVERWCS